MRSIFQSKRLVNTSFGHQFRRLCFRRHSFATVIIAGNTLPAIAEDIRRCLFAEVNEVLRPGGVLAVAVRRFNLARFETGASVIHHNEPLLDEIRGCMVTRSTELKYFPETNRIVTRFSFRCLFPEGRVEEYGYELTYVPDYADRIAEEARASGFVLEAAQPGYGQPGCSGTAAEMLGIVLRSQVDV